MNYFKNNLKNTWDFLKNSKAYFRDVLLMHGFLVFVMIPLLSSSTKFILKRGGINYISNDNLGNIIFHHPMVAFLLFLTLLLILLLVFFEFTFLLLSVYFIEKKKPISLRQLLRMTLIQMKKLRPTVFLFFLFYFLLVLPIGGLSFNSDLLSKIKIPAFIMDYIFTNRLLIISAFIIFYLFLIYVGIRVIFALPEMILRDISFQSAVKESLKVTRRRFFEILGRFLFIGLSLLLITTIGFGTVISAQSLVEELLPEYALYSAVFAMTILQFLLLLNIILNTVGIFYIIVDFMNDEGFLPEIPRWFYQEPLSLSRHQGLKNTLLTLAAVLFGVGVCLYNMSYLTDTSQTKTVTISHRGVNHRHGIQNTIEALSLTNNTFHPDYVEMDIQMTSDQQFVVYHDFDTRHLTGVSGKPEDQTLADLTKLTVKEHGQTAKIDNFNDYLAKADELGQKLLIEIKTQKNDPQPIISRFLKLYGSRVQQQGHIIQSLSYPVVEAIKQQAPELTVGYILPFNVVGPPITAADFLTMEYSTINRNFINSAKADGKRVFVWTPNDEDSMNRMIFYGVDGIITDELKTLDETLNSQDQTTYADKLLNFVIGVG